MNDVVLLRTASSLEHSAINVYSLVIDEPDLLDPIYRDVALRFRADHEEHAALFEELTRDAGGQAWTCGNPRIDSALIQPVLDRITVGAPATTTAAAIPPSDDPRRDVLNFAHALESLAGATYQALVALFQAPLLRAESIAIGAREVRHAALLALTINQSRPGGYLASTDAGGDDDGEAPETTAFPAVDTSQDIASATSAPDAAPEEGAATEIPSVTAIPAQFAQLGAVSLVIGAGDENGTRLRLNLETPSLNSLVYEYQQGC